MRLDLYLFQNGLLPSRARAKEAILAGEVLLNGVPCRKPAELVTEADDVALLSGEVSRFVSRGGRKLEAALIYFGVSPKGRVCLDIGASTGGFTDCLLQYGAARVYAVDSGTMQLAEKLATDMRVVKMENTNARYLTPSLFDPTPSLAVMDVSFISQTLLHPMLAAVLPKGGLFLSLIKPQFEAGRQALSKKGIVRARKDREASVRRVVDSCAASGFRSHGVMESPITGGSGNYEYLALFERV